MTRTYDSDLSGQELVEQALFRDSDLSDSDLSDSDLSDSDLSGQELVEQARGGGPDGSAGRRVAAALGVHRVATVQRERGGGGGGGGERKPWQCCKALGQRIRCLGIR